MRCGRSRALQSESSSCFFGETRGRAHRQVGIEEGQGHLPPHLLCRYALQPEESSASCDPTLFATKIAVSAELQRGKTEFGNAKT